VPGAALLRPQADGNAYAVALATTYRGLAVDAPEALPASLHADFDAAFQVHKEDSVDSTEQLETSRARNYRPISWLTGWLAGWLI
jgi:hypothetical protein